MIHPKLGKIAIAMLLVAPAILLAAAAAPGRTATLPDPAIGAALTPGAGPQKIVLAGGCFWGIQAVFEHVEGVIKTTAGYSGGTVKSPDYEMVSTGTTGHAESVEILYDPARVSFGQLLKVFFSVAADPTELNYQGPDYGTQYRSAIFFATPEQARIARAYIAQLQRAKVFSAPIVTQVAPLTAFYPAEAYHQDFALHHPDYPYIVINDLPKVEHLRAQFPRLYVSYQGS